MSSAPSRGNTRVTTSSNGNGNGSKNGSGHKTNGLDLYTPVTMPTTIVKRDGRIVHFEIERIEKALARCFASFGRSPSIPISELAKQVGNIVAAKYDEPTVENVQDSAELVLQAAGEFEAAKRYILYRAEHAKLRSERPVPEAVRAAFDESDRYFPTDLQKFQFYDKYSRFNYDLGRRETWIETVDRSVDFLHELAGDRLPRETYERIRQGILEMRAMPSMRLLAMAGAAARRNNVTIYNCSYMPVESIDAFVEALIISMSGCGVGYSVERKYVENFSRVKRQSGAAPTTYFVEDSAEGWADALRFGLHTWFDGGDVRFDLGLLRAAGAPLRTKGGRASGPEPLRKMFEFIRSRVLARQGSFLRPIDAHDIMCAVGNAAVSGGVRRTAMISLFDYDDSEMRHAKDGDFERENSQRWNANNSAVLPRGGLTQLEFAKFFLDMVEGGRGEPGIFNRESATMMRPERRKEADFGTNPCVTGDTWIAVADGRGRVQMQDLVREGKDVDVFTVNDNKVVVRKMRRPRRTGTRVPVVKVNFADGTSVRVTPNHKFVMTNGAYKQAMDLEVNDALTSMTVCNMGYDKQDRTTAADYDTPKTYRMLLFANRERAEHRAIYEHMTGKLLDKRYQLHHIDFDSLNNHPSNLRPMTVEEHAELHDVQGDKNPNALAISNPELELVVRSYIRHLGYRPSITEYQDYAKASGFPQSFAQYRRDYFGGDLQATLKRIAKELGCDNPPYTKKQIKMSNSDVHYKDGLAYVMNECKYCGEQFEIDFANRDQLTCSLSCGNKLYYKVNGTETRKEALREGHEKRKDLRRDQQMTVYNDLVVKLGRHPFKEEWIEECKQRGISPEISRVSSPFRFWDSLKEAASHVNHRVESVEPDGYEDVYNGTVDETHTYFTIGCERERYGRTEMSYVLSKNCGEIVLRPHAFCNLSVAVARQPDTYETLRDKVELAAIIGTIQSLATHFPGLRKQWQENCEEERLLGVDINGQLDSPASQDVEIQRALREVAIETNRQVAAQLNINQSASVTCVKPSGNSSQLLDCSSGIHTRWAPHYIRNVRVATHSPIFKVMRDAGAPLDPENGQAPDDANTWVIHFPVKSPDGAITRKDRSAIQQCEYWLQNKLNWTEHNPSVTITYQPHEVLDLMKWVWEHVEYLGGITFLPAFDAMYDQMPYMEIDRAEYEKAAAHFPAIDFSKLYRYEEEDLTNAAQELACLAGVCDVDFAGRIPTQSS